MSGRRDRSGLAALAPFLWLGVFFLFPFLLVAKLSLSDTALAIPPYTPRIDWSQGWAPAGVEVPTAFALFPADIGIAPRELAERYFAVERFTVMPRGGHFAAIEEPGLLAEDLLEFVAGRH